MFDNHKITDYTASARELINTLSNRKLRAFGHDTASGKEQMCAALDVIDKLAEYDENAAEDAYLTFMQVNLSGTSIELKD